MPNNSPFSLSVEDAVEQIRTQNPKLQAFVSTRLEEATQEARRPSSGSLSGVPFSLKDVWDTKELPTTGGSYRYKDRLPAFDSTINAVLQKEGAILLGKTNTADLGLAIESRSHVGGVTKNPLDHRRTAGGSSGGAAAAVAAGLSAFDWGSDFGGSIRIPAAYCGLYGLRLASAAWPLHGHFPASPGSLKFMVGQGPIAKTLDGIRAVVRATETDLRQGASVPFKPKGVIVYADPDSLGDWPSFVDDVTPLLQPHFSKVLHYSEPGSSVDVRWGKQSLLPAPRAARNMALAMFCSHLDALREVEDLSVLRGFAHAVTSMTLRGVGRSKHFHPTTAQTILLMSLGRYTLYRDADKARADAMEFKERVLALGEQGFVIVMPTVVHRPPRHGMTPLYRDLLTYAAPGNIADATALAIPWGSYGKTPSMPRSLQLWGPAGAEHELLDVAERLSLR